MALIFYVDDDHTRATRVAGLLSDRGHQVRVMAEVSEALEQLPALRPAAVVVQSEDAVIDGTPVPGFFTAVDPAVQVIVLDPHTSTSAGIAAKIATSLAR